MDLKNIEKFSDQKSLQSLIDILNFKNKELRLLYETSRFFSAALDINLLYDKLFDVLRNIVDMQDMFVATYNPEKRTIKYIYLRSIVENNRIDVSPIPEIPLAPEGKGIISEAIRKNDTLIIRDYQKRLAQANTKYHITNHGTLSDTEHVKDYIIESAMIVPIKHNGSILGFITLMSKNKTEFDDNNKNWIETIVNQAAIANKNAMLFAEVLSEAKEKNKLLDEIKSEKLLQKKLQAELNTRIKENMKIISDVFRFQEDYFKDELSLKHFNALKSRADVISVIQDYIFKQDNLTKVDMENFIKNLVSRLYEFYNINPSIISFYLKCSGISLPYDKAITCGLIINELLSYTLQYSFPKNKKGNVTIELSEDKFGNYSLHLRDTGNGNKPSKIKNNSFNFVLAGILAKNIYGNFKISHKHGSSYIISFKS